MSLAVSSPRSTATPTNSVTMPILNFDQTLTSTSQPTGDSSGSNLYGVQQTCYVDSIFQNTLSSPTMSSFTTPIQSARSENFEVNHWGNLAPTTDNYQSRTKLFAQQQTNSPNCNKVLTSYTDDNREIFARKMKDLWGGCDSGQNSSNQHISTSDSDPSTFDSFHGRDFKRASHSSDDKSLDALVSSFGDFNFVNMPIGQGAPGVQNGTSGQQSNQSIMQARPKLSNYWDEGESAIHEVSSQTNEGSDISEELEQLKNELGALTSGAGGDRPALPQRKGDGTKHKPWMNQDILEMIDIRDKLYRRMKKAPQSREALALYKKARNAVVSLTRAAKRNYEKDQIERLTFNGGMGFMPHGGMQNNFGMDGPAPPMETLGMMNVNNFSNGNMRQGNVTNNFVQGCGNDNQQMFAMFGQESKPQQQFGQFNNGFIGNATHQTSTSAKAQAALAEMQMFMAQHERQNSANLSSSSSMTSPTSSNAPSPNLAKRQQMYAHFQPNGNFDVTKDNQNIAHHWQKNLHSINSFNIGNKPTKDNIANFNINNPFQMDRFQLNQQPTGNHQQNCHIKNSFQSHPYQPTNNAINFNNRQPATTQQSSMLPMFSKNTFQSANNNSVQANNNSVFSQTPQPSNQYFQQQASALNQQNYNIQNASNAAQFTRLGNFGNSMGINGQPQMMGGMPPRSETNHSGFAKIMSDSRNFPELK